MAKRGCQGELLGGCGERVKGYQKMYHEARHSMYLKMLKMCMIGCFRECGRGDKKGSTRKCVW